MANLDFATQIKQNAARLETKEQMLGKGNNQPFNAMNSGSRKIMSGIHSDHAFVVMNGELPIIGTGYENRFGDYSSSIIKADDDYVVIAKIPKFSFAPNHHYYLILKHLYSNELTVVERISYKYVTEVYGYLNNNTTLDHLQPGYQISKDTVLKRSIGFDEFGNKTNGVNLNTVYMAMDNNMEDSIVISDVCAKKMRAPLIRYVRIIINENDIPLNLYGDDNIYKAFPDIGENVKNGLLFAYRREKKEYSLYTQSYERLKDIMMSDEKFTLGDTVLDLNIYCNNPANLSDNIYNSQFKMYYEENLRMCQDIVKTVGPYVSGYYADQPQPGNGQSATLSYELQKLFANCKRVLKGDQYLDKRPFSNLILEFYVLEERDLGVGDKMADRFGGKGVVSEIRPQHLMPRLPNGEYADIIVNQSTMYNRENAGQIMEVSLNYIARCLLDSIYTAKYDPEEALNMILQFVEIVVPEEASAIKRYTDTLKTGDIKFFIESIVDDGFIALSTRPITDCMDIDRLALIYKSFPWIKQSYLQVPLKDSNGNIRYVNTRRPLIMAKKYMERLKQFAEEKFSATSLSPTNIKNENSRSKASKNYRELYPNTPIKFGPMESGEMNHLGSDVVIVNLMIHSLSPHGRRLVESMHTQDPFHIDIKLDSNAKNRSVEIVNTRLKTMGYRLVFNKIKKKRGYAIKFSAVEFENDPKGTEAVQFIENPNFNFMEDYELKRQREENRKKRAVSFVPVTFEVTDGWNDDK